MTEIKEIVKNLPTSPGVYLFRNRFGKVIYVGKAINLKSRVGSYFQKNPVSNKLVLLVSEIKKINHIRVASEFEALLLEANLIKKHKPYFNYQLKDDKDYLYIKITKEDFPRVLSVRKKDLDGAKIYFGPFPSAYSVRSTLKLARKIFSFRTGCRPNSGRACLGYHLGLCPGVCVGSISSADYRKIVSRLTSFFKGNTKEVLVSLEKEMKEEANLTHFEKAQSLKKMIAYIKFSTKPIEGVERYLEGEEVLTSIYEKQLQVFTENLNLKSKPVRIECYDISHLSGSHSVGSMVVLLNGQISKADYRRFKIKTVSGINDPGMMHEVLTRRFHNDWPLPDLIVVDGGKTQLSAGLKALYENKLTIPIVGLAKRNEEIHIPDEDSPLRLPKDSPALFLIQRIRDEAHRFAITYHRNLRSKEVLTLSKKA